MNWYHLIKLAAYKDFRDRIEQHAKQNPYPFRSWFDRSGRVYIPFEASQEEQMYSLYDKDIIKSLEEKGCTNIDYRNGKCIYNGQPRNIGGLIGPKGTLRYKDLLEINRNNQSNPDFYYNVDREIQETNELYDDLLNGFNTSPVRTNKGQNQFMVVISQDPHDVASMSTDRNWTSCMELGKGSQHQDVFCEVAYGGLVAYLIRADDLAIKRPLARIHIRRFESRNGQSIAMPEREVYGNEMPGFFEVVDQWLIDRQGKELTPGMYTRMGGEYSDTFSSEMLVAPTDEKGLVSWLTKKDPNSMITDYSVDDELAEAWNEFVDGNYIGEDSKIEDNSRKFINKEEAEEYFNNVTQYYSEEEEWIRKQFSGDSDWQEEDEEKVKSKWEEVDEETGEYELPRFKLYPHVQDLRYKMQNNAIRAILDAKEGAYSPETIKLLHSILFEDEQNDQSSLTREYRSKFFQKFPSFVSNDDLKKIKDKRNILYNYGLLTPEQQEALKAEYTERLFAMLEDPESIISEKFSPTTRELDIRMSAVFNDYILGPLQQMYKPIPEPIIRKIVEFAVLTPGEEGDLSLIDKMLNKAKKDYMWRGIAQVFHLTNSDTPTVQRYYKSLLPYWGENHRHYSPILGTTIDSYSSINVGTLGYDIAKLGENGRDFIPFIQKKLDEERVKLERAKEQAGFDPKSGPKNPIYSTWSTIVIVLERNIESYLYILDNLENNGHSSGKYRFNT